MAPYSAPQTASASAESSVLMKVPSSSRSRSGLAWASCSSSRRAGSILDVTVIVGVLLRVGCERSLEGSPGGRRLLRQRHAHRDPYTTLPDVTRPARALSQ